MRRLRAEVAIPIAEVFPTDQKARPVRDKTKVPTRAAKPAISAGNMPNRDAPKSAAPIVSATAEIVSISTISVNTTLMILGSQPCGDAGAAPVLRSPSGRNAILPPSRDTRSIKNINGVGGDQNAEGIVVFQQEFLVPAEKSIGCRGLHRADFLWPEAIIEPDLVPGLKTDLPAVAPDQDGDPFRGGCQWQLDLCDDPGQTVGMVRFHDIRSGQLDGPG